MAGPGKPITSWQMVNWRRYLYLHRTKWHTISGVDKQESTNTALAAAITAWIDFYSLQLRLKLYETVPHRWWALCSFSLATSTGCRGTLESLMDEACILGKWICKNARISSWLCLPYALATVKDMLVRPSVVLTNPVASGWCLLYGTTSTHYQCSAGLEDEDWRFEARLYATEGIWHITRFVSFSHSPRVDPCFARRFDRLGCKMATMAVED